MRVGKVIDYEEKRCYPIDAKEAHLSAGAGWPKPKISTIAADNPHMTEKHTIGFSAYGSQSVRSKLFTTAMAHKIWSKTGGFINVPEEEWMPIPLQPNARLTGVRMYQQSPDDRKLIDKIFNLLHEQGKMEWSTDPTQYGSPVFVIWQTLPSGERKRRVVTDI